MLPVTESLQLNQHLTREFVPSGDSSSHLLCSANRCTPAPGRALQPHRLCGVTLLFPPCQRFAGIQNPSVPRPSGPAPLPLAGVPSPRNLPPPERRNAPRSLRFVKATEYLTVTITCKYSDRFVYGTLFALSLASLTQAELQHYRNFTATDGKIPRSALGTECDLSRYRRTQEQERELPLPSLYTLKRNS